MRAGLTFNSHLKPFEVSYVKALGAARPAIWGFHPYYAVNCEQSASVSTFESNLPKPAGQVWFTEVGAWECRLGQSSPRGPARQLSDASYLVNTLMSPANPAGPAHVFYYEMAPFVYTQSCSKYADSALYMGVTAPGSLYARPAAATIYGLDATLASKHGRGNGGERDRSDAQRHLHAGRHLRSCRFVPIWNDDLVRLPDGRDPGGSGSRVAVGEHHGRRAGREHHLPLPDDRNRHQWPHPPRSGTPHSGRLRRPAM